MMGVISQAGLTIFWRILQRRWIHSVFNLGICFYSLVAGMLFPIMVGDYITVFLDYSLTDAELKTICSRLFVCRVFIWQLMKIPTVNCIFR